LQKHANLETAHRQLEIIHDLTVLLQAAPDLISVQERVLGAVTTDLGFSKRLLRWLIPPAKNLAAGWCFHPRIFSSNQTTAAQIRKWRSHQGFA
jgi:hypothetical protein